MLPLLFSLVETCLNSSARRVHARMNIAQNARSLLIKWHICASARLQRLWLESHRPAGIRRVPTGNACVLEWGRNIITSANRIRHEVLSGRRAILAVFTTFCFSLLEHRCCSQRVLRHLFFLFSFLFESYGWVIWFGNESIVFVLLNHYAA